MSGSVLWCNALLWLAVVFWINLETSPVLSAEPLEQAAERAPLIVHEWGVMIRQRTTGGTMLGPPAELANTLPPFVLHHDKFAGEPRLEAAPLEIWDKPVLHFYGREDQQVRIHIGTAKGRPLYYWPQPQLQFKQFQTNFGMLSNEAVGMVWQGKLVSQPPTDLPAVAGAHWWHRARQVPGQYLQTSHGSDRFLFYEATAFHDIPVEAQVRGDTLSISRQGDDAGPVLLIANDDGHRYARLYKKLGSEGATLRRAELLSKRIERGELLELCREFWLQTGLTATETDAVVDIWSSDLADTPGFLMLSTLPRKTYDVIFPIEIDPVPSELVRVGVIIDTLQGQPDRGAWLDRLQPKIEAWGEQLGSDDFTVRDQATRQLLRLSDIANTQLLRWKRHQDAEVAGRAELLLAASQPRDRAPPPVNVYQGRARGMIRVIER